VLTQRRDRRVHTTEITVSVPEDEDDLAVTSEPDCDDGVCALVFGSGAVRVRLLGTPSAMRSFAYNLLDALSACSNAVASTPQRTRG
jgi:hypothetical protein